MQLNTEKIRSKPTHQLHGMLLADLCANQRTLTKEQRDWIKYEIKRRTKGKVSR